MTYLLSISIGPVQEFIAAARRTADLRAGSQLLQQLAQYLATQIAQAGGTLIFPATPDTPGPNRVVAQIATDQPADLVKQMKEDAVQWLMDRWQGVRNRLASQGVLVNETLAREQIAHFLEFYAAWVPLTDDYATARQRVEALLSARKALRDFDQPTSLHGVPKSPLDPARDCVLVLDRKGSTLSVPEPAQRLPSLRLKKTEFLDAVSLLKRGQDAPDVPSTSRMAAQSVLAVAQREAPDAVQTLQQVVHDTGGMFDIGDLMFPSRFEQELPSSELTPEQRARVEDARKQVLRSVGLSECPAYYVVLAADGDRMGRLISAQRTIEKHRALSQSLAEVAKKMMSTIHRYNGYCVYAGGDDVLALLPVNRALECAVELSHLFREAMQPFVAQSGEGGTLSAGVAIVHHLESLQRAVDWAREAEHQAKKERNAVGVALHVRGGAPLTVVTSWAQDPYLEGWTGWIQAFRGGLSHGFPYELLHLAREVAHSKLSVEHLHNEALRIFDRKQGREAKGGAAPFRQKLEAELNGVDNAEDLKRLSHRLIIARFLSRYPEVSS